jgi:signal transduction histidine kinase
VSGLAGMVPRVCSAESGAGSPKRRNALAQLLHALNQPLTGLQCSMEVTLAVQRSPEQYRQGLREGLELTARMRELVEAIREVVDGQERTPQEVEIFDLHPVLQDILAELALVAESRGIRAAVNVIGGRGMVRGERRRCATLLFQTLEAAMSLAAPASELRISIEEDGDSGQVRTSLRIHWCSERSATSCSRADLALLVAEAGWGAVGAQWCREPENARETITIQLPQAAASRREARGSNS